MEPCEKFGEWISESIDRPLPEDRRQELARHLSICERCVALQLDLEGLQADLSPSAADVRRLWPALDAALAPRPSRAWLKAAALVLIGFGGFFLGRAQSPEPVAVAPSVAPGAPQRAESEAFLTALAGRMTAGALIPGAEEPDAVLRQGMAELTRRALGAQD